MHERFFLIDCGEGTQMQLRRHRFRLGKIHHIFLSHIHGDHVFGLYGLLSTFSLLGREYPLTLFAPDYYEAILRQHLRDFDIFLSYELIFVPLSGKQSRTIYEDQRLQVECLPLKHRVPAYGFLFREKARPGNLLPEVLSRYHIPVDRIEAIKNGEDLVLEGGEIVPNSRLTFSKHQPVSYAYCSDTAYTESFLDKIRGTDLLFHEATFDSSKEKLARSTGHSTAAQAAQLAAKAGVGKLILGHFSARYKKTDLLLEEARAVFPASFAAYDGAEFEILPGGFPPEEKAGHKG